MDIKKDQSIIICIPANSEGLSVVSHPVYVGAIKPARRPISLEEVIKRSKATVRNSAISGLVD